MTDRELMQQALDLLDDINQCSLPPTGIPLPAEIDHVMEALIVRLSHPEQEPVAWVETLENAQPHCVTDLKYCSVMQHERGEHLKYIPLYIAPPQREWQRLTDEEITWLWNLAVEAKLENMPRHFARMVEEKLKEKNT